MNRIACVFLVVALLAVPTASAQMRESVTVEVIEVPVYISAPDGTPIRGLQRDAFELFVNGRRQPIEYFDAVDLAAATASRDRRERRLYLLLFDWTFASPMKIARAQRAAAQLVDSANAADYFAVATYRSNKGIEFATAFLNDRIALRRAIDTLSVSQLHDPLGLGVSAAERMTWLELVSGSSVKPAWLDAGDEEGGDSRNARATMAARERREALIGGAANQEIVDAPMGRLIELQVDNLADVAARLAALEGQKHVVLFSEGFQVKFVNNPESGMVARSSTGAGDRTANLIRSMGNAFKRAGVFLDAVDVAGLRMMHGGDESLQVLAHGTGGEFVHNENDIAAGLQTLAKRQEVVYLLGFQRRNNRGGSMDVRVKGLPRGAHVTFRPGFGAPPAHGEVDPLQLADILVNDIAQNGVRVATKINARDLEVALFPKEIVPQLVKKTPYVDALLYIYDTNGNIAHASSKRIEFGEAMRSEETPVVIREHLALPAGKYVVKTVVNVAGTNSLGFAKREIQIE